MSDRALSLNDQRAELGRILGLDKPVEEKVLLATLGNETYAQNLLTCQDDSKFLDHLLKNPPVVKSEQISNSELIKSGSRALINWGKTGFSIVGLEVLERRENACLSCPNLRNPAKTLQKVMASKKSSDQIGKRVLNGVCRLCGCNATMKIRLPSENCPDRHPEKPGLTRWGDPFQSMD